MPNSSSAPIQVQKLIIGWLGHKMGRKGSGKEVKKTFKRDVFVASLYQIWKERNQRFSKTEARNANLKVTKIAKLQIDPVNDAQEVTSQRLLNGCCSIQTFAICLLI
ncbi:hypothetical protein Nepgr_004301 [Nepenthes gracilis]|uniref:Uncharacterized protein n=1 Tax=Nepenthes gracilis TaxID=150966 RepID=A0AAD3S135_NEPGR|nr:hypothetical protein Nepgr_004301 [Nepenthes gracilis]